MHPAPAPCHTYLTEHFAIKESQIPEIYKLFVDQKGRHRMVGLQNCERIGQVGSYKNIQRSFDLLRRFIPPNFVSLPVGKTDSR